MVAQTQKFKKMKQLIGLSLSMCIKDLVEGKLGNDVIVHAIIAGTAFNPDNLFEEAYAHYSNGYWDGHSKEAYRAAFNVIPVIIQPRLDGLKPPKVSNGYWLEVPVS